MAQKPPSEVAAPAGKRRRRDAKDRLPRHGQALRTLVRQLQENLTKDLSEVELAAEMGMPVLRLRALVERMYATEEAVLQSKTPARLFVDYSIHVLACVRHLEKIAEQCLATNQAAGAVGAVKAKADLYDRILTRGQDLGVLAKKPKEVRLLGRIDVTHMTTADLKRQVETEQRALLKLVESLNAPSADRVLLAEAVATGENGNGSGPPDHPDSDAPSRDVVGR